MSDEENQRLADRVNPVVVACLRVKNEGRWIRRVLLSLKDLCSQVLVLDNRSTDNTRDEVLAARRENSGIRLVMGKEKSDEGEDRQRLLEFARALKANWILNIDGDEELEAGGAEKIRAILADTSLATDAWCLKVEYLWNRPDQIRVDGWYRDVWMPRLFRVTPSLSFSSIKNGIHTRHTVEHPNIGGIPGLALWHYGYMLKSDRLAKFEYYNRIDPHNVAEDYYRHMVIGDLPELPASALTKRAGPLELKQITNGPKWTAEDLQRITGGSSFRYPSKPRQDLEVALL